ncbi:MAG: hypothetical protein Q8P32_03400 [Candidatus Komeilibacteria bacterium]|nr:hypothetical protein [Candidatus Komeilibacteria bacterium]
MKNKFIIKNTSGLSSANTELIIDSSDNQKVCKSAIKDGVFDDCKNKLIDELKWYQSLNVEAKSIFPEIKSYKITSRTVKITMPYYFKGNTFENNYLKNNLSLANVVIFLDSLLNKLYLPTLNLDHPKRHLFLPFFLKEKLYNRKDKIKNINFSVNLVINKKQIPSLDFLLKILIKSELFKKIKKETRLCKTHGDLTFKNILIDERDQNKFIFIDVNPKRFVRNYLSDPTEDISRILAYMYPILPIKQNAINWEKITDNNYTLQEDSGIFLRHKKNFKHLFQNDFIYNLMLKIYPDKKKLKIRVHFFWVIHVLTIALSRIVDGKNKNVFGFYLFAHRLLYLFLKKYKLT